MASETYKLMYFNGRGRAEIIRFLFAYGDVKYEDARFDFEEWPKVKPTVPFGQLPVLYVNKEPICDSGSATRYLAKKLGLCGKTDLENAKADVLLEATRDIMSAYYNTLSFSEDSDEIKKTDKTDKFYEEKVPAFLTNIENLLKGNGGVYFVGKQYTYADLSVVYGIDELATFSSNQKTFLDKHEKLKSLVQRVHEIPSIKKWLEKRPKSAF